MAKKKPRTPAPPRPVQAPQRRDTKQRGVRGAGRGAAPPDRRSRWILYGLAALGPIALVVVLVIVFTGGSSSHKTPKDQPPTIDYAALQGVQKTKAPWAPEYQFLPDRLRPLGLDQLSSEVLNYHVHQHLDIWVNGEKIPVPAFIGIDDSAFLTELHTHDASGIIHVEAGKVFPYTLGQFFGVWGLRLSKNCIGAYCAKPGATLKVYVNGKPYTGDPNNLVLKNHEEIAIVYGKPPTKIPSTYGWAAAGV